jgi:methyl-accepting chemotaxis protein
MPSTNTESRYSVSTKIFLIAASYSLPIAVLVWLMISSINANITFGTQELAGNAYQRPLFALLDGVQSYQLAGRGCAGEAPCDATAPISARIEKSLGDLDQVQSRYGTSLQFTTEGLTKRGRETATPATVREQWAAIAEAAPGPNREKLYPGLVTTIRTMITHSGDTSNLILDPDLDSYYLMDVTLLAIPQMQDRVGRIAAAGYDALASGAPLTSEQRAGFAADVAMLSEADAFRVEASTMTAMNEDANFNGVSPTLGARLRSGLERWKTLNTAFSGQLKRLAAGEPVVAADFLRAGVDARQAAASYWSVGVDELDQLLQARIRNYEGNRTWALFLAAIATLGATILSFVLLRSITEPLDGLVQMLGPGATLLSSSVERIAENSRDKTAPPEEAEIICEELNAHAEKMRMAVLELAAHVQGSAAESRMAEATGARASY